MADEENENQDETNAEEGEGEGKKKFSLPELSTKVKIIIAVVAGVLFLVGAVVGTLYFLGIFESDDSPVVEEQAAPVEAKPTKAPAMYFPIKPEFIVNFQARGRQRYLQVEVSVMTRDQQVFSAMQQHLPLIKNKLVMLFGGEVYEELQTDEGRELLRQKSLEAIQQIMLDEVGVEGVEQVLFTNFVMQ